MLIRFISIYFVILFIGNVNAQENIDSLSIYNFQESRGYTTSAIRNTFVKIKQKDTPLLKVTIEEKQHFNNILNNAKKKRHFQTKIGAGVLFAKINNRNSRLDYDILICPSLIIDLSNSLNYNIHNEQDKVWLKNFIRKYSNINNIN